MSKIQYARSLEDELDWKLIDQLHSAVSQVSSFCFEAKKLCVSIVFVAITLIATFTEKKLDTSIFVAGSIIPLFFWLLDSVGYYYQVKLRALMEGIREKIVKRNKSGDIIIHSEPFIAKERAAAPTYKKVFSSLFNHSMWLYGIMVGSDLLLWVMFYLGFMS